MLKIGQIGIGHNHSDKIKSIQRHPELFQLVGYAEENEEWVARRGQRPHFIDVPRMSVDEIIEKSDAILVETDVWDLTKTAQKCIDAGKHIHMDKPASGTLEEFKHLLDTAKEKNLVVQMGYMYRYNPAVQKLFEMVKNGVLGEISAIHAEMSVIHSAKYRKWLGNFQGGDMYIFGSHLIDLIVYLLGKPNKVLSSLRSSGKDGVDSIDLTSAILEYDHAIAQVFSSSVQVDGHEQRRFTVDGRLGTVHINPIEGPFQMTFAPTHDGKTTLHNAEPVELRPAEGWYRYDDMMIAFHDYVLGIRENPFSYEHDYIVHEAIDQAVGGIKSLGTELEALK